jgi:hypothetical protein
MTKKQLWLVIASWLIWRVALLAIGASADWWLKYEPTFPYAETLLPQFELPRWLYSWANFDGVHYLTIVQHGYKGTGLIQAFFPLYPLVAGLVSKLGVSVLVAALVVSNLASLGLWVAWFKLVKQLKDTKVAWWALAILALLPTSFFWGAAYSESLFGLLVVVVWLLALRSNWVGAALVTALASATRVVGVALVPTLLGVFYSQNPVDKKGWGEWGRKHHRTLLILVSGASGLLIYMTYLGLEFGDPLFFFHVQAEFGAGRQESLVLYPQVVWRYLKILVTFKPINWRYWSLVNEAIAGTAGLLGIMWGWWRTKSWWWLFALAAFMLPTLTGTFSSLPRYILVCFPLWLEIAAWCQNHRWRGVIFLLGSATALIINTVLFIQGYWVA